MELRFGDLGENYNNSESEIQPKVEFPNEWADYAEKTVESTPSKQIYQKNQESYKNNRKIKKSSKNKNGISSLLSGLNTEDILLLALLYILYEEGADRLTLLALAYILLG